ncbi:unnamed protein product [Gordionus sp. m RMFG-2023]|uniref:leucine-rich repeat-containing protein 70-like n=1 Tax=Gordionus sp. m RMFG-2023 TaxID=3053472 RepID=UPI0030E2D7E7
MLNQITFRHFTFTTKYFYYRGFRLRNLLSFYYVIISLILVLDKGVRVSGSQKCVPCGEWDNSVCTCCSSYDGAHQSVIIRQSDGSLLTDVNCRARGLKKIPDFDNCSVEVNKSIHSNSVVIGRTDYFSDYDASHNNVTSIGRFDFACLTGLRILSLSHNRISVLEAGSFGRNIYLDELDLSFNEIPKLEQGALDGLKFLKSLNLAHNSITAIDGQVFQNMPFLEEIRLNHNPIHSVGADTFKFSEFLKRIDISSLKLTSVPLTLFNLSTPHLTDLNMSYNSLAILPSISTNSNIERLDLSGNAIDSNDLHQFLDNATLTNLKDLTMDKLTNLRYFSPGFLLSKATLKSLVISRNPHLVRLDEDMVADTLLPRTESLNKDANHAWEKIVLSDNRLTTLSPNVLPFAKARSVDLSGNPWVCNCSLEWMLGIRNLTSNHNALNTRCNDPPKLRGKSIFGLHSLNFTCSITTSQPPKKGKSMSTKDIVLTVLWAFVVKCILFYVGLWLYGEYKKWKLGQTLTMALSSQENGVKKRLIVNTAVEESQFVENGVNSENKSLLSQSSAPI